MSAAAEQRPSRLRKPKSAAPTRRRPGKLAEALRVALVVSALGALVAAIQLFAAGHAPSWRSLGVIALQSAPLLPGFTLLWLALAALARRFAVAPMALWIALAILGAAAAMLVFPGLVYALLPRGEAFEGEGESRHWLVPIVVFFGGVYLYATTAFRLWFPWGLALPVIFAGWFWRANRNT